MIRTSSFVRMFTFLAVAAAGNHAQSAELLGHWKLQGDCRDYSGHGNDGVSHGVNMGPEGAVFDGLNHYVEIPDSPVFDVGTSSFTITAWVKCDGSVTNVPGDIVNKYDPALRRGINLHVNASSPGYASLSDARNVQFGIDNAVEGEWEDCGRPWPSNSLISTLVVFKGHLYTGIADASDPQDGCHMFRYDGGQKWVDCGRVSGTGHLKNVSVFCDVVHQGELYAGSGIWDWEKVWKGLGAENGDPAQIYRYAGGTTWEDCGQLTAPSDLPSFRVSSIASFGGHLYASDNTDALYRYDDAQGWTACGRPGSIDYTKYPAGDIVAMMPYQGKLYAARHGASVFRYSGGTDWEDIGEVFHNGRSGKFGCDQIHTLGVYQGSLYLGTWPDGKVLRYEGGHEYSECGWVGIDPQFKRNEVNDLTVYNGKLYAGVIPKSEVWRYEGGQQWTMVRQLLNNPDFSVKKPITWDRVPCMTVYGGRLYCGTGTCHGRAAEEFNYDVGKVFSFEAGKCISYDDDLGSQWRHVAAVREKNRLRLYVDGRLVASSTKFDPAAFDLTNDKPLLIGFGQENYFNGMLRDVRLYGKALSAAQVKKSSKSLPEMRG
ncbi:MAG: LamG domain-containing protein [Candidatus Hydrogenedentes bacterium]|nr:LamG domain-containing protein [Candidatus Hydrogenedentota bacterium]